MEVFITGTLHSFGNDNIIVVCSIGSECSNGIGEGNVIWVWLVGYWYRELYMVL